MRMLGRIGLVLGLACLVYPATLAAQLTGFESFKWYVGAQGGVLIFETPTQTYGAIPTIGVNLLVTAKRTGLQLSVEEGFKNDQSSSYADPTVLGGARPVAFNNVRKYSATLMAFPFRTIAQPYIGVGVGYLHTVREYPLGFFGSPAAKDTATTLADQKGGYGFGALTGGVQFRVSRFMLFGQYQITSAPQRGKLIEDATHAFTAGIRFGLGNAREETTGGGY